jgi:hypothetical protein
MSITSGMNMYPAFRCGGCRHKCRLCCVTVTLPPQVAIRTLMGHQMVLRWFVRWRSLCGVLEAVSATWRPF